MGIMMIVYRSVQNSSVSTFHYDFDVIVDIEVGKG